MSAFGYKVDKFLFKIKKLFKISKLDLLNQNETIYLLKDQVLVTKR